MTSASLVPVHTTALGSLFQADCLEVMAGMPDGSVDLVFADPPFNLNKDYGQGPGDNLSEADYLAWSFRWLEECCRILAPGGSLFVYNLPRWLTHYAGVLNQHLMFRHWITVSLKMSMPIAGRLYPAHYGLLYYTKGKPRVFNKVRLPIQACRHCGGDIKDYGGHRKALNPLGLNLTDVWDDIPPVRHAKYKNRSANQLAPKMLERVFAIALEQGPEARPQLVFDPFGGSGTTYYVAEKLGIHWVGCEIADCSGIVERLNDLHAGRDVEWKAARVPRRRATRTRDQGDQIALFEP